MEPVFLNLESIKAIRKGLYLLSRQTFERLEQTNFKDKQLEKEHEQIDELYEKFYSLETKKEEELEEIERQKEEQEEE